MAIGQTVARSNTQKINFVMMKAEIYLLASKRMQMCLNTFAQHFGTV